MRTAKPGHPSADFPSDELRSRLRRLGIPGGRHRYGLLCRILRDECGLEVQGSADEVAKHLIRAMEKRAASRRGRPEPGAPA
jgi:hypothetical protein